MSVLSRERMEYIRHQMELSSDWIGVIEKELDKAAVGGNDSEFNRLAKLLMRETQLVEALRHALHANQDTLALL